MFYEVTRWQYQSRNYHRKLRTRPKPKRAHALDNYIEATGDHRDTNQTLNDIQLCAKKCICTEPYRSGLQSLSPSIKPSQHMLQTKIHSPHQIPSIIKFSLHSQPGMVLLDSFSKSFVFLDPERLFKDKWAAYSNTTKWYQYYIPIRPSPSHIASFHLHTLAIPI